MKRPLLTLALLALLAAVPAFGEVVGFLEPPVVPPATTDNSTPPLHGVIRITGWVAVENEVVRRVTIQVDGVDVGEAFYQRPRPQIADFLAENFPGSFFPDANAAGFSFFLNGTDFSNGVHEITAKVLTNQGTEEIILGVEANGSLILDGIHELFWTFNTNTLPPFGFIDSPQRNAELFGNCCRRNDAGNCCELNNAGFCLESEYDGITAAPYSVVDGWVLDLGKEIGDSGVGYVELLIDGTIVGNSRKSCTFNIDTGGLTDCYGLQRLDVERNFPFASDAPSAGFRFAFDVGRLIRSLGFVQGSHVLTIRSGDISNQTANVYEIPVNFLCLNNNSNLQSFGRIESPRPNRLYFDLMNFQGWAVDIDGVDRVEIFVDGASIGLANIGVASRPEVLATFPGYPDAPAPVWRLLNFDTTNLSEGLHQVQVEVTDDRGVITTIGEADFFVDNQVD